MTKLSGAIKAVDWKGNVDQFLAEADAVARMDAACTRLAIWSRQIENVDSKNPAISFVRAMQISAHHAVATAGLAIYKASASSIRGIVENALYYSYFRSHSVELASLVRDVNYYVSKSDILSYHKLHTPNFKVWQDKIGLLTRIESWYSSISAVVHGQVPGVWVEQVALSETKHSQRTLGFVVEKFSEAERIVHELFLLTIGKQFWDDFSHGAKREILKGMPGEVKTMLQLDTH